MGLVLDGICDNLVFGAAYVGCILALMPLYGWWIWPIALLAGASHSAQSASLDFYNREYLYFGCGLTKGDYWNPDYREASLARAAAKSAGEKWLWLFRSSWIGQQEWIRTRSSQSRRDWRAAVLGLRSQEFMALYRAYNKNLLRVWRPLGANVHTIGIIGFAFLGRFDLYLVLIDILALNLWLLAAIAIQKRADRRLLLELAGAGLVSFSGPWRTQGQAPTLNQESS
jgi:hypothetical protein